MRDPDDARESPPADPEEVREAEVHLETIHGPDGAFHVTVTCRHRWDDDPCCGCGHRYGHGPWEPYSWEWEYL